MNMDYAEARRILTTMEEQPIESSNRAAELQARSNAIQREHGLTAKGKTMSMIDPSEWNLDDSQEPYALRDGVEAKLRIVSVEKNQRRDRDGTITGEYWVVRIEVPDEPYSKEITDFLDIPDAKHMDAKRLNTARDKMRKFCDAFEIDRSRPFDPSDNWPGQEGWGILSLTVSPDYGEQNRVRRYIVPK